MMFAQILPRRLPLMIANEIQAPAKDPSYGWVMVFAVFTLSALAFGTLGTISVFLKPLSAEFGWTRGETSLGYTVISFSSAIFGILWGYIADKYGTRYFGFVAAIAMAASLFALSGQQSIYQFYGLYFFKENYNLDQEEVYDFVLSCKENKPLLRLFSQNKHEEVMQAFSLYLKTYQNPNVEK